MELEFIIPAKHPPNAGKKIYCFGPLGHLLPFLASVVQELSQFLCAEQPAFFILAEDTTEVLTASVIVCLLFSFYFLLFYC